VQAWVAAVAYARHGSSSAVHAAQNVCADLLHTPHESMIALARPTAHRALSLCGLMLSLLI